MISDNEAKRADIIAGGSALSSYKLKEAKAIRELVKALGSLERGFVYGSLKGEVLTLFFNHPAIVSEFNMQKEQILEKMRKIYKEKGLKESIVFKSLRAAFVAKSSSKKRDTEQKREEIATGDFEIKAKDLDIKKALERIREHIRLNAMDARSDNV